MRRAGYAVAAGACAAGAARLAYSAMSRRPPGGPKAWSRTNHRGEPVTLLEGPAVAAGALAGVLAQAGLAQAGLVPASGSPGASGSAGSAGWRRAAAMVLGGAGAAAFGAYDDLAGSGDRRGFRGHLGALRQGEVTTGAVKLGGIGVTGVVSAALAGGSPVDVILNAGLVAGGANLLNLFDLRPGRAIKVAAASGALLGAAGQDSVAAPLGAALALLPEDLGERAMLGDAGANALGAMLGASAAGLSRPARIALLAGIAGLTAASEKVSFTKVIARTPALNWLDMLGRRPVPQTEPSGTEPSETAPPRRSPWSRSRPSGPNRAGEHARSRTGECSAAGRGDRPGRRADRRDHDARAGHRLRPPGGVRAHRPGLVPGHRVHHREHGAEHHLRHRGGRRPHRGGGAGAGRSRAVRPRAGTADLRRAAHLGRAAARPGQPGGRGHRASRWCRCCSAGRPAAPGPTW